jgi:nucleoside-diphosphate-sugar epimerase
MRGPILLTGAAGFVGRQVLKALLGQSCAVKLVVREGQERAFENVDGIIEVVSSVDMFAESASWWENVCTGVDTIIHVAWYAEPGEYLQSPRNLECLKGSLAIATAGVKVGVRRIFGVGTCFEYDLTGGYLSVATPLNPLTLYAAAKAATFLTLQAYCLTSNVEFGWGRLFYLYGDGEDVRRFVPYVKSKLAAGENAELTSGHQIRDFMDVADAGQKIAELAISNVQGAVNICSGTPITIRDLAEKIADEYGRRDLLKFGMRADNLIDPLCVVGVK